MGYTFEAPDNGFVVSLTEMIDGQPHMCICTSTDDENDMTVFSLFDCVMKAMIGLGFHPDSVRDAILDVAEDYAVDDAVVAARKRLAETN